MDINRLRALAKRYLPWVAALLVAAGVTITISIDGNGDGKPDRTFTVLTAAPKEAPITVDSNNQQSPDEIAESAEASTPAELKNNPDIHEDTRDETPPGVSAAELAKGREATSKLADKELLTPQKPAGAQSYSCIKAPVVNQSQVNGRRVGVALHFTVSASGTLDAIRRLFNTPSFGASSNYGFEPVNLRCQAWVPFDRKAWAQGAANSAYVSIEIVSNDRSRASWLATPMIKRGVLAALVRDLAKRIGAPMKLVDPVGCVFTPGITDHNRLECGNSHWDVGAHFPWDVFMRQVRAGIVTAVDRVTCRKLNWWRDNGRPKGKAEVNAVRRRNALDGRGITCTSRGPVAA